MNLESLCTIVPLLLVAVLFQFTPLLTRRGIFFSATVDPEFPRSSDGRRLLTAYRLQAAVWTLLACGLAVVMVPARPAAGTLFPTLLLVVGIAISYWTKFRQVHSQYGVRRPEVRATSMASAAVESHSFSWIAVPPFIAIAVTAWYLHAHWEQLPAQFPVHWGPDGQPNGWAGRDFLGVYGSLLLATGINLFFLLFGWAISRASRNNVMRRITVRMLQMLMYPVTFAFVMVALLPLIKVPVWLIPAVVFAFLAVLIHWAYRRITAPVADGEIPEPQSDTFWKAGLFYYNPNDPSIFVSKRVGIGYSMNFANKRSWAVLFGILLIVILPAILAGRK